jgi:hypothetical protein
MGEGFDHLDGILAAIVRHEYVIVVETCDDVARNLGAP